MVFLFLSFCAVEVWLNRRVFWAASCWFYYDPWVTRTWGLRQQSAGRRIAVTCHAGRVCSALASSEMGKLSAGSNERMRTTTTAEYRSVREVM